MSTPLACLLVLSVSSLSGAGLKAGAARADITPPVGLRLEGFSERTDVARGVQDPLMARALVLETKDTRVALVTLDICLMFSSGWIEELRRAVRQSSGITHLIVTASHTHSGPALASDFARAPAWEREALRKTAAAVAEAHAHAVEAKIATGYGKVDQGYNRRRVHGFGNVEMVWENPAHKPMGLTDPTVGVLRIDALNSTPVAILVHHAVHPVVYGMAQREYSADFIAPLVSEVEASFGGATVCLFLQGACGNVNPYDADVPADQDPRGKCAAIGKAIGREAVRVARATVTNDAAAHSLTVSEDVLLLAPRWKRSGPSSYAAPVTVVLLDRRIALMTMPGEPFVEFQLAWKQQCPVPDAFLLGYANGYLAYFPTLRAAAEGGYGAADEATYVEAGAGERMLDQALIRVHEMLGHLRALPRAWDAIKTPE